MEKCCVGRQCCNKLPSAAVSFNFSGESYLETICSIHIDGVDYMYLFIMRRGYVKSQRQHLFPSLLSLS